MEQGFLQVGMCRWNGLEGELDSGKHMYPTCHPVEGSGCPHMARKGRPVSGRPWGTELYEAKTREKLMKGEFKTWEGPVKIGM